jgi:rare lipoprotein A
VRRWSAYGRCALLALAAATLVAGCVRSERPGEPSTRLPPSPDVASIPDPVPRYEPRSRSGNPPFYEVFGKRYAVLASAEGYVERGVASWYGPGFHAARTSSGEPYDMYGMTAAHKTLPLPCYARVTNLANRRSIIVRINDRGPFVGNRIIDLSYTAAAKLDMLREGTAFVEVRTLTPEQPALERAAPAQSPVAASSSRLFVQVGAFSEESNARRLSERLRAAGVPGVFMQRLDGGRLHRVRVGPVANVTDYDALVARLTALGVSEAQLAQE